MRYPEGIHKSADRKGIKLDPDISSDIRFLLVCNATSALADDPKVFRLYVSCKTLDNRVSVSLLDLPLAYVK